MSLFTSGSPDPGARAARKTTALGMSLTAHAAVALLVVGIASRMPADIQQVTTTATPAGIVWMEVAPGPGRGGGGGGESKPEPAQRAEAVGADALTVRVAPDPSEPAPAPNADPPPALEIPAVETLSGLVEIPGTISPLPTLAGSRGPGTGPGAGGGAGPGDGPGKGGGLGPGQDGNTGGDVYEPGNGVSMPRLIRETKPVYPSVALQLRLQGLVFLEGVVLPDGSLDQVRITRSLDSRYGLDEEAIRTVKQWRFAPGRDRDGRPVPVRVAIEMAFTLR